MSPRGVAVTLSAILGLFLLHGVEIWIYIFLYQLIGAVDGLRHAVYFSTITYGAIGYGDTEIAEEWRLVSHRRNHRDHPDRLLDRLLFS